MPWSGDVARSAPGRRRASRGAPLNRASLEGRCCVVTGATSGIGRITAIELARRGARVGIVARDPAKAAATADEVRGAGGGRDVPVFLADLGLQSQVRRVAGEILAEFPVLHVLVNNAGVVELGRTTTADGIETMFAVNHLAYFLLAQLLVDRLRESAPARIVNVASHAHRFVSGIRFDDPFFERGFGVMRVYGHSKLANILFTRELARRLDGTGVTVNCLHPGAVATGLGRNNGAIARALIGMLAPFFRTPEQGAKTTIHLASAAEVADTTGGYFARCREVRPSAAALDDAAAARLWALSERLVEPPSSASAGGTA